jgi:hypothetical protein
MMLLALFTLALQGGLAPAPVRVLAQQPVEVAADSLRDVRRAHSVQGAFERARRLALPLGSGSGGRCDVQLGRFCWWYDERPVTPAKEPPSIARRRASLVAVLDSLGARRPGDEWIAGMRVFYRIEAGQAAEADSVARDCRAARWWCLALGGYAQHARGLAAGAESSFVAALQEMSPEARCRWRDIAPLLPSSARKRYERAACEDRVPLEERYWMLSRPRLAVPGNEWRTEYSVRRILSRLAERATTPQAGPWGRDSDELLLRYGWPVAWSRLETPAGLNPEPSVIGHDPTPSFAFAPDEALLDTAAAAGDDAWDLNGRRAESRFAPRLMTRAATLSAQFARFRRGDSVLVAAAYAARDDSLTAAALPSIGATLRDGSTVSSPLPSGLVGRGLLRLAAPPILVGVEIADSATSTLARARSLYAAPAATNRLAMSDLLLYRAADAPPTDLEAAMSVAIPGDTASRARGIGVFWETYGVADTGESLDVTVTVERIDRSWVRGARQRLGLASPDSPLRLRWNDARPPAEGPASRAISLDLGNLEAGRYRITVALSRDGLTEATASREVRLQAR